jgi:hypothetical protein
MNGRLLLRAPVHLDESSDNPSVYGANPSNPLVATIVRLRCLGGQP